MHKFKISDLNSLLIILVPFGLAPLIASSYFQGVLVLLALNAILVTSFRTITTMGGWSFAHVATMGIGAYSVAILSGEAHAIPVTVTMVIGVAGAMLFGFVVSIPVLRTRQYYFFLATFAAGEALRQSFLQFKEITGGATGIAFIPRPEGLEGTIQYYYFVLGVWFILSIALKMFDRSEIGASVKAVGLNEDLAVSLGINAWRNRSLVFVIGSGGAGLVGGLLASYNGVVSPADFNSTLMFKVVASAIVGGTTTFTGPLIGLLYLTAIEEIFRGLPRMVPMIWGVSVVSVLLFARSGIDLKLRNWLEEISGRKGSKDA